MESPTFSSGLNTQESTYPISGEDKPHRTQPSSHRVQVFHPMEKHADSFTDSVMKMLFVKAHNRLCKTNSPSSKVFLKRLQQLGFFLKHEHNISNDPITYLKSRQYTQLKKLFDLSIGGPLAALVDLVVSAVKTVLYFVGFIAFGAAGIYKFAKSGGEDRELLKCARNGLVFASQNFLHGVRSALRVPPVVGVFLGYLGLIAAGMVTIKCENWSARR